MHLCLFAFVNVDCKTKLSMKTVFLTVDYSFLNDFLLLPPKHGFLIVFVMHRSEKNLV